MHRRTSRRMETHYGRSDVLSLRLIDEYDFRTKSTSLESLHVRVDLIESRILIPRNLRDFRPPVKLGKFHLR